MRRVAMLLLAVLFVTLGLLSASTTEAANGSLPFQNPPTRKGFVVAKTQRSMTVLEGRSTFQVNVTEQTRVVGRRTSFAKIAVDDVVRVEGSITADGRLVATQIEVLLAGDGITPTHRAKTESDRSVTLVTW